MGVVFRLTRSGEVTVLHNFDAGTGKWPHGELIEGTDGLFYGTTTEGGPLGYGTAYRMDRAGAVTVLRAFDAITGPPWAALLQASDGFLYGTTEWGKSEEHTSELHSLLHLL